MSKGRQIRKGPYVKIGLILGVVAATVIGGFGFGQSKRKLNPVGWVTTEGTYFDPFLPKKQPSVLLFILADCPIANKFAPEISRIMKLYESNGVHFTVVHVDTNLSPEAAKRHAKEYGLDCTLVLDPTHSLAKRAGATVSPEAVVIAEKGQIVYRGRIDDRAVDYGKFRPEPKQLDLRVTLDLVLMGKPVKVLRTKAVGCIFRTEKS